MSVTEALAHYVERTDFHNIPRDVIDHAKVCFLDWLGCAIAGSLEPAGRIAKELITELGAADESTVIGTMARTSAPNAALINGVFGHSIELDDIHEESVIHPAAPVMPAALAICEKQKLSGADLLTAIVLGYQIEIRIAEALMPSHYRYWHPTGTCGTFGAAAAAGKLLSLGAEQLVHAFGMAGTQASGLIEVFGTMSKPLNAGKAAMTGVISTLLAKKGFTSSNAILEAEKGYCKATSDQPKATSILERLETFEITRNVFKRHSCCGHIHGALDGVLDILEKHRIQPEDIRKVKVGTYPIAIEVVGRSARPTSASEARFNLPFCVALALLHRRVGPAEFAADRVSDDTVFKLSKRVDVEVDPELSSARLGSSNVEVELKDGRSFRTRVDHPKGYHDNPLSRRELEEKFESLASLVLDEAKVKSLIGIARDLESFHRLDDLFALLRTNGT